MTPSARIDTVNLQRDLPPPPLFKRRHNLSSFNKNLTRSKPEPVPEQPLAATADHNYNLVRMDTERSIDSHFSLQQQYRVSLQFTPRESALVRHSWLEMLVDEPLHRTGAASSIPGAFPVFDGEQVQKNGPSTAQRRTGSTQMALSLFCQQLYANLLAMDPRLESLFPLMRHQAVAFAGVVSFAVLQLENLSVLDEYLMTLGKRHARVLGIEPASFELMGEALVQTFHERFGGRFSHELEILWIKLYLYLANLILQFGIDPVLRLGDDRSPSVVNPLHPTATATSGSQYATRESSRRPSDASHFDSVFDSKRGSVSTVGTSPLVEKRTAAKRVRATITKKKNSCAIM